MFKCYQTTGAGAIMSLPPRSRSMEKPDLISGRRSRSLLSLTLLCAAIPSLAHGQSSSTLPIMPLPASATPGQGEFVVDGQLSVAFDGFTEPRLFRARERFLDTLSQETGIPFSRVAAPDAAHFQVHAAGPSKVIQELGEDESYQLTIA